MNPDSPHISRRSDFFHENCKLSLWCWTVFAQFAYFKTFRNWSIIQCKNGGENILKSRLKYLFPIKKIRLSCAWNEHYRYQTEIWKLLNTKIKILEEKNILRNFVVWLTWIHYYRTLSVKTQGLSTIIELRTSVPRRSTRLW